MPYTTRTFLSTHRKRSPLLGPSVDGPMFLGIFDSSYAVATFLILALSMGSLIATAGEGNALDTRQI